jgi:hypothetical protein
MRTYLIFRMRTVACVVMDSGAKFMCNSNFSFSYSHADYISTWMFRGNKLLNITMHTEIYIAEAGRNTQIDAKFARTCAVALWLKEEVRTLFENKLIQIEISDSCCLIWRIIRCHIGSYISLPNLFHISFRVWALEEVKAEIHNSLVIW